MTLSRRQFLRLTATIAAVGGARPSAFAKASADLPSATGRSGRPLGVALLGLGRYASGELAPALQETKRCKLVGVVSGHPEKAKAWAAKYSLPLKNIYNYDNFDSIAHNPDIDIVYVVTPPGTHREFVTRAAKAGKHVISEKPLATSVADCDAMIAACAAAKVRFSVGYRLFFDPYHTELRRLARDQDFGVLKRLSGDRGFIMRKPEWRIEKVLGGGGPMMDLGIYIIQGACMACNGETPVSVMAKELPKQRPEFFTEVEEAMKFQLVFANGSVCNAQASYNKSGADYFKAEGDKGWIEFKQHAFTYKGIVAETSRGPLHYPPPFQQALQMDDFADCITTGRATPVPGEMGKRDIRILYAIYEAAASGKRVLV